MLWLRRVIGGAHALVRRRLDASLPSMMIGRPASTLRGCQRVLAGYIPARRPARVDPIIALRAE
jgi:hypothetical protein